ncbi:MAG: pyridoxal phosphate-dependent aminotransferase [Polyangiaceae bacterium]
MIFARRTDWDRTEGRFAAAVAAWRARGGDGADLTESNPTRAGLLDASPLVAHLGHARGTAYVPDALGHPSARAAVSAYYAERGLTVDPARTLLTASTSEAYGYLFKLLCERGDRVLVPSPSYPLFDFLAASEDIVLTHYPLVREHNWRIDLDALERAVDDRTRAILLVHPNNPTGSLARRDEADALERIARDRNLALIVDEVFGDYPLADLAADRLPSFAGRQGALTFVLSGLSKVLALPQLKLAWMAISGPEPLAAEALARLELLADTYLSVATPVQLALPDLFAARADIQTALRARTRANLASLDAALTALGDAAVVRRLPVDAGWYAILEVPRIHTDDAWIELLLDRANTVVHPGYFFDFDREGFLIVSLLPPLDLFRPAIDRVLAAVTAECT